MSAIPPIQNDHSRRWHQQRFAEFAEAKLAIGEPTPHMQVVAAMSEGCYELEKQWRAGCYLTAYSVLTGEGIWREWSYEDFTASTNEKFRTWLTANWAGVHTRKPRRCVRTPKQFSKSLIGYYDWITHDVPGLRAQKYSSLKEEYETWWKSAISIPYFGRYVVIRVLEYFRREGYLEAGLFDIRAIGAHSPIRCLMLLRPEEVPHLLTGNPKVVDAIAEEVKASLKVDLSYFIYATLLCEYRSSYEDRSDYAGNQHDEELEYSLSRYAKFWEGRGFKSKLYPIRAKIDHHECLGEIQGWDKRRLDVAGWLHERGIVWSDLEFDYLASRKADKPVVWRN